MEEGTSGDESQADNATANTGPLSYDKEQWLKRLRSVEVFESDIHRVIMNYFSVCGHEAAAREFMKETNTQPEMPLECISARRKIWDAVISGDMDKGIELINKMEPMILQANPDINFCLRRYQLVALLESGEVLKSLEFAQEQLAPCVRQHVQLLPQLEEVMTLLTIPSMRKGSSSDHLLGDNEERRCVAQRIDDAILQFYNVEKESLLQLLVKNLHWTQKQLVTEKAIIPLLENVQRGGLKDPQLRNSETSDNRHDSKTLCETDSATVDNSQREIDVTSVLSNAPVARGRIRHSGGIPRSEGRERERLMSRRVPTHSFWGIVAAANDDDSGAEQ